MARGVRIKYIQVACECWAPNRVMEEVRKLRSRDEEKELAAESEICHAKQMTLWQLYNNPPPLWVHPVFACEFGDSFISGTSLETSSLQHCLQVMTIALKAIVQESVAGALLNQHHRAAISCATARLEDATDLANSLAQCIARNTGEQYLSRVLRELSSMSGGDTLLLPCMISDAPLFVVITRGEPPFEDRCTLTIVANAPEHLAYHASLAYPPKIKFETTLELVRSGRV